MNMRIKSSGDHIFSRGINNPEISIKLIFQLAYGHDLSIPDRKVMFFGSISANQGAVYYQDIFHATLMVMHWMF
jgi:hypothetical protein